MDKPMLSDGSACILVKYLNNEEKKLIDYLNKNRYKHLLKGPIGLEQYKCDWYWININSKIYCIGKPGVAYTKPLGDHAITVEEFIIINDIFEKYNKKTLEM